MYTDMQISMYSAMCFSILSFAGAFGPCCAHAWNALLSKLGEGGSLTCK